ncbi:hypothetical protein KUCAC02_022889 [Chaenocephalus aceratus]|uniref:Uncharacterized protein n=1 Tax=Chaenocephalus aceratus TaxID=36190 RepID=A0ACB9XQK9_CHAAC|nr:hypothetical protein KUCAC02_022889 [Chaenocephalus aceratus]
MMAEGRFASLPRSLHAHHALGGGTVHHGVPSNSLGSTTCSSRGLQSSLASSMDLLSSKPGLMFPPPPPPSPSFPTGHGSGLSDLPASAYQQISIHGTLPRRKRGGANLPHGNYTWNTSLPPGHAHQPLTSPLVQHIIDDFHGYR